MSVRFYRHPAVEKDRGDMMRKRLLMLVVALIVVGGIGLAARHVTYAAKSAHTAPAPTVPIVAGTVQSGDVPIYLRGVGTVIAYNNVVVRSQITGQIIKIPFTEGQTVKRGDLLAEIDPPPTKPTRPGGRQSRSRSGAVLNAQANLNRYVPLQQEGTRARNCRYPEGPAGSTPIDSEIR